MTYPTDTRCGSFSLLPVAAVKQLSNIFGHMQPLMTAIAAATAALLQLPLSNACITAPGVQMEAVKETMLKSVALLSQAHT
jgi:hypothetical protein